jgi:DNA-binding GntR family transcriptional regulator
MPSKLTLAALATSYGVSTAPVRQAINDLLESKEILKLTNGRIIVNPERLGIGGNMMPQINTDPDTEIESEIMRVVLVRSLGGRDDEYIREEITAERHRIGRTVLRRILSRMAGAGIIVHEPCRGWRIRPFRYRDMEDYITVRETLEVQALDIARNQLDEEELRFILKANVHGGSGAEGHLDNRLHRHWIDRCDNYYIRDFFDRHGCYYTTLFDYAAPESKAVDDMVDQHRLILNAILQQNWELAKRELSQHIRSQKPILKRMIDNMQGEALQPSGLVTDAVGFRA